MDRPDLGLTVARTLVPPNGSCRPRGRPSEPSRSRPAVAAPPVESPGRSTKPSGPFAPLGRPSATSRQWPSCAAADTASDVASATTGTRSSRLTADRGTSRSSRRWS